MNRPDVSRAIEEIRTLREEAQRTGETHYVERLTQILNLLQISPPK